MVGKKVVHHLMMSAKDAHYVGGLVNGARIVDQWGDVGTELMVYVDGDISLFLGYENIEFLAPVQRLAGFAPAQTEAVQSGVGVAVRNPATLH